jgi:uncharacterized protein YlxP (DUF503 family)
MRHARTLKDKRNILKSLEQRLKNLGFSVTELAHLDTPKQASLGFVYVGRQQGHVERVLDDGLQLFVGDFEVADVDRDVFDYTHLKNRQEDSADESIM